MRADTQTALAEIVALDGSDLWDRELELSKAMEASGEVPAEELEELKVLHVAALLRLQLYDAALAEADSLCSSGDAAIARAAACVGLQRFSEARRELASISPEESSALCGDDIAGFEEHVSRLETQSQGTLSAEDLVKGTGCGTPALLPPLAEYVGGVEAAAVASGGRRGLRVTRATEPGQLLLCSRALVRTGSSRASRGGLRSQTSVEAAVGAYRRAAELSPRAARVLGVALSSGTAEDAIVPVEWLSWQGSREPAASRGVLSDEVLAGVHETNSFTEAGVESVYPAISLANHSCAPSCLLLKVGNAQILRACRRLEAGTEVTIAYFDTLRPLGEREQRCRSWGFVCACPRCQLERGIPPKELYMSLCVLPQMACAPIIAVPDAQAFSVDSLALDELEAAVRKHTLDDLKAHWLRASFVGIYKSRAEAGSQEAQELFVQVLEATVPGFFFHCRQLVALWKLHAGGAEASKLGRGASKEEHRAWRWCLAAHKLRYGKLSSSDLNRVMQETMRSVENHRDEFCRASRRTDPGEVRK